MKTNLKEKKKQNFLNNKLFTAARYGSKNEGNAWEIASLDQTEQYANLKKSLGSQNDTKASLKKATIFFYYSNQVIQTIFKKERKNFC